MLLTPPPGQLPSTSRADRTSKYRSGLLVPQGSPTTSFFGEIQKFFGLDEDPWQQCDPDPRGLDCGGPIRERWKFDDFTKKCDNTACGEHMLDPDFNLATKETQEWIVTVCEKGREFELVKLKKQDHCALEDFRDWLKGMKEQNLTFTTTASGILENKPYPSFPVPESDFYDLFQEFLSNPVVEAKYLFQKHIILDTDAKRVQVLTVAWQSEFMQLGFYSPESLHDKFDMWKDFEKVLNKEAPAGADRGFGTTGAADGVWMNYAMSKEFIDSVYRCGPISAAIALFFLAIATKDARVVVISMTSILSTVIT